MGPSERSILRAALPRVAILLSLSILACVLPPRSVRAEEGSSSGHSSNAARIDGRYKFMPLPYLNYNRSIGFAFGGLPMVMFNPVLKDEVSPSSMAGLLGVYTTNDTWFVAGFTQMYFAEDRWRFTGFGGSGSINFQFYLSPPINAWVPYNAATDIVYLGVERKIYKALYGGISYLSTSTVNTVVGTSIASDAKLSGLGFLLSMDTRSSVYYPYTGFYSNVAYFDFPAAWGNENGSGMVRAFYNHYWPTRKKRDVLAARTFVGIGVGDLTFNQQFIVGRVDIRGYSQGEYRGNSMADIQAEYRWNFARRWGAVGFAGLATVFDSINSEEDGKLLPGIGVGIRFTAFVENHMNIGLDVAVGDGDWGMYFRIGEAY